MEHMACTYLEGEGTLSAGSVPGTVAGALSVLSDLSSTFP